MLDLDIEERNELYQRLESLREKEVDAARKLASRK
jgi:hypothetical protein